MKRFTNLRLSRFGVFAVKRLTTIVTIEHNRIYDLLFALFAILRLCVFAVKKDWHVLEFHRGALRRHRGAQRQDYRNGAGLATAGICKLK